MTIYFTRTRSIIINKLARTGASPFSEIYNGFFFAALRNFYQRLWYLNVIFIFQQENFQGCNCVIGALYEKTEHWTLIVSIGIIPVACDRSGADIVISTSVSPSIMAYHLNYYSTKLISLQLLGILNYQIPLSILYFVCQIFSILKELWSFRQTLKLCLFPLSDWIFRVWIGSPYVSMLKLWLLMVAIMDGGWDQQT